MPEIAYDESDQVGRYWWGCLEDVPNAAAGKPFVVLLFKQAEFFKIVKLRHPALE